MELYDCFVARLNQELIPALGCTEPIAIALASAKVAEVMGANIDRVRIKVSGNILKNVKSVLVPNTNGLRGVDAACVVGLVGGKSELGLEVLEELTSEQLERAKALLETDFCTVSHMETDEPLHIIVEGDSGNDTVVVELKGGHTDIVKITKNGEVLFEKPPVIKEVCELNCKMKDVYDFANDVKMEDIAPLIRQAVKNNTAIAKEGLTGDWGQHIGKTLLKTYGSDVNIKARALAAAGSDARMSGCSMPVTINSGSGNQGLTITMPIVVFADELKVSEEKKIRALVLANLVAIYIKKDMGKLSAFCGAVSASCGAGAGIAYLNDLSYEQICMTVKNTLGNISGLVCDGAKGSCAAKISSCVDACILGFNMAKDNVCFKAGDGIIREDIDETIKGIANIGRNAMRQTDVAILDIMLQK